jgi:hypothetical protein
MRQARHPEAIIATPTNLMWGEGCVCPSMAVGECGHQWTVAYGQGVPIQLG